MMETVGVSVEILWVITHRNVVEDYKGTLGVVSSDAMHVCSLPVDGSDSLVVFHLVSPCSIEAALTHPYED